MNGLISTKNNHFAAALIGNFFLIIDKGVWATFFQAKMQKNVRIYFFYLSYVTVNWIYLSIRLHKSCTKTSYLLLVFFCVDI